MPSPTRHLLRNLALYVVCIAAGITVLGLLEQQQPRVPFHWGIFIGQFVVFLVLIDMPLVVLALWVAARMDATMERVGRETLERALPIAARLFTAQWEAERAAGRLPVPPEATETGKETTT